MWAESERGMFQPSPQSSWLEQNLWHLVEMFLVACGAVAGYVRLASRVENNEKSNAKDMGRLDARVEGMEKDVEAHCSDKQIHIDPVRDERRWQVVERKLDGILDRLDRMK
jgi:hypothetical protein